MKTELTRDL